jgi:hypothetical protein
MSYEHDGARGVEHDPAHPEGHRPGREKSQMRESHRDPLDQGASRSRRQHSRLETQARRLARSSRATTRASSAVTIPAFCYQLYFDIRNS